MTRRARPRRSTPSRRSRVGATSRIVARRPQTTPVSSSVPTQAQPNSIWFTRLIAREFRQQGGRRWWQSPRVIVAVVCVDLLAVGVLVYALTRPADMTTDPTGWSPRSSADPQPARPATTRPRTTTKLHLHPHGSSRRPRCRARAAPGPRSCPRVPRRRPPARRWTVRAGRAPASRRSAGRRSDQKRPVVCASAGRDRIPGGHRGRRPTARTGAAAGSRQRSTDASDEHIEGADPVGVAA